MPKGEKANKPEQRKSLEGNPEQSILPVSKTSPSWVMTAHSASRTEHSDRQRIGEEKINILVETKAVVTSAEFRLISQQLAYLDVPLELIEGEIIPMPSSMKASSLALRIGGIVLAFVDEYDLGYVTTTDGAYEIDDINTYAPDVGYISKIRLPEMPDEGYCPIPPDLAIEIVSPSDLKNRKERIEKKLKKYEAVGVPLVWYFYQERKEVEIYRLGEPMQVIGVDGILDGGDVLPGFRLPVNKIFK